VPLETAQNALTSAIKEYGALRRTVYAARYLADETGAERDPPD
jgi:TnpA family transposase